MNVMKRAYIYLIRKKGRMLFLLILLFLMSLSILVGISFKESTERELERLRQSMASGFILKADVENEMYLKAGEYGRIYAGPTINEEMIEKICSIDGVKDYTVDLLGYSMWADLTLRPGSWAATAEIDPELYADPPTEEDFMLWGHEIGVCPCKNGELHKYFRTGALTITEGRNIKEGDHFKAVVSDWLAEKNNLSVGDIITAESKEGFYMPGEEPLTTWGEPIELEITGLFHANFSQESSIYTPEFSLI